MVRSRNNSISSNSSGSSTGSHDRSPSPEPRTRDVGVQALMVRDQVFTRLLQLAQQPNAFFLTSNQTEIQLLVRQLEIEAGCRETSVYAPILIMSPEVFVDYIHQRLEYLAVVFDRRARLIRLLTEAGPE